MTGADDTTAEATAPPAAPLVLIRGEATAEEVAAVVAVLQGVAAASAGTASGSKAVPSAWSSPARKVRAHHAAGAGGWRASALPR